MGFRKDIKFQELYEKFWYWAKKNGSFSQYKYIDFRIANNNKLCHQKKTPSQLQIKYDLVIGNFPAAVLNIYKKG